MANDLNIVYKIAADITGLQSGVERAAKATEGLQASVKTLGAALGVSFSAAAVVSFGKELIADADAMVRLHDKTGITLQGLQKFQIAGDEAGNSIEDLTSAIAKMEDKLASGDKNAIGALARMGVSFEDIKHLNPENQFFAISEALRKVQDPAQQVAIAIDLFGKAGANVLPTLKRGFDDLKDASVGMTDETIRNLDKMGDDFARIWRSIKATTANAWVDIDHTINDVFHNYSLGTTAAIAQTQALIDKMKEMATAIPPAPKNLPSQLQVPTSDSAEVKRELEAEQARLDAQKKLREEAERFAKSEAARIAREQFEAFVADATAANALAAKIAEIEQPTRDAIFALQDLQRVGIEETLGDWTGDFQKLQDTLASLQRDGLPYFMDGLNKVGQHVEVTAQKTTQATDTLGDLARAFAELSQISDGAFGGAMKDIGSMIGSLNVATKAQESYDAAVKKSGANSVAAWGSALTAFMSYYGMVQQAAGFLNQAFGLAGNAVAARQLPQNPAQLEAWIQAMGGAEEIQRKTGLSADELAAHIHDALSARTPEAFAAALQPIIDRMNAVAAAAAQLASDVEAVVGPSKDELQALADKAHQVYDTVAAGVKTGQYTQAQAEIAFTNFMQALANAGDVAAAAWVKAHAAATDASQSATDASSAQQKALDALKSKRDSLAASIANEAPEEVTGVIESQTRGQMAALDQQIADQQQQFDAAAQAAADSITTHVGEAATTAKNDMGVAIGTGLDGAGPAADTARSDIEHAFAGLSIEIPYYFVQQGPGPTGGGAIAAATGGIVMPGGLQRFADGGEVQPWASLFRSMGTDTEPAMLTPGELILNASQQRDLAKEITRPIHIQNTVMLDGVVVARNLVKNVRYDTRGIGTDLRRELGVP